MRKPRGQFGLSLLFSLIVFGILLVTSAIMGVIGYFMLRSGAVEFVGMSRRYFPLFIFLMTSVLIGTIVALAVSFYPLRPLRTVIKAIEDLAKGDFKTRLKLFKPPVFRELAESFNRMAEELGGIEVLRTDFVNNFSHEFKTPIVSIKGFAEMLKHDDLDRAQREEYLDIIIDESERLTALATNVLNLSKLENQAILSSRTEFDLTEQLRRCILLFEGRWEQKGLTLSVELEELRYTGSEDLLNQVWLNLLDNAVKFTPEGGSIRLRLFGEPERVVFSIRDSGCGLGEEALAHIFDKFYQADISHTAAGNGLGLTVARRVARLHGGDITCVSAPGEGAEFTVSLPCPPLKRGRRAARRRRARRNRQRR